MPDELRRRRRRSSPCRRPSGLRASPCFSAGTRHARRLSSPGRRSRRGRARRPCRPRTASPRRASRRPSAPRPSSPRSLGLGLLAEAQDLHELSLATSVADAHHPDLVAGLQRGCLLGQPGRHGTREHGVADQVLDRERLGGGPNDRSRDPQFLAPVRLPSSDSDERDDSDQSELPQHVVLLLVKVASVSIAIERLKLRSPAGVNVFDVGYRTAHEQARLGRGVPARTPVARGPARGSPAAAPPARCGAPARRPCSAKGSSVRA